MRKWWAKVRALWRRDALTADLSEEMQAHFDLMVEDHISRGLRPDQARRLARKRIGNELATRERAVDVWRFHWLENGWRDVRYALRSIGRTPSFSATVLLTLALGIGATTAIFSLLYSVTLRPLPYPQSERLVVIGESAGEATGISTTWGNLRHWKAEARTVEVMAGYVRGVTQTLTGKGDARVAQGWMVSHEFFGMAGWTAEQGRLLTEADDHPAASPTVVVSHDFWRNSLGAGEVVGTSLVLDDRSYEVVGVLPADREFLDADIDFYQPIGLVFTDSDPRSRHGSMRVLGRLSEGVTPADAARELDGVLRRLALDDPGPEDEHRAHVAPLADVVSGAAAPVLWLLLGAVGLVLALACANVANLLLGRGLLRGREMAIRSAIGAGRGRLVRQMLTETLLIAALGGGLGVLLAAAVLRWVVVSGVSRLPRLSEVALDLPILAFAAVITVVVGLVAAIVPVFTQRGDVAGDLKEGSRFPGAGRAGGAMRGALVVAEVAITLVLAFSSALLLRSLASARNADLGFAADRVLALELRLPTGSYPDADARLRFYSELAARMEEQPWAESAAALGCPPSRGNCGDWWYSIPGRPQPSQEDVPVSRFDVAQAGAFSTLGLRMRAGREFTSQDRGDASGLIVNEAFVRLWWSSPQAALGQSVKIGGPYRDGGIRPIVGVVADASQDGPDRPPEPEFWLPLTADPRARMTVLIRTVASPGAVLEPTRALVASLDPALPVWSLYTLSDSLARTLESRRFGTWLLTLFAGLAMVLAAVGVYGVLQQWVASRRSEIALRLALGAGRPQIVRLVGGHVMALVMGGLGIGTLGMWSASRLMGALVFGVSPMDPLTMAGAVAGVVIVAAAASGPPLARALRVDTSRELQRS